ncbi:MAG: SCP2 sterol-binding domain-containing protein [Promethearchaeota archaeon]
MSTTEELIEALNIMRQKFLNEKVKASFKNWNKTMQYYFPDKDEYWNIELKNGVPEELKQGEISNPAIKYEMDTDTFLAITRKQISGMKAYQQKKVKVKAKMPDLMKLQKLDKL